MNAFEVIRDKTAPAELTAIEWVIWNARASLPRELLEQAADQLAAKDEALEAARKLTDGDFIMTDSRGRVLVDHTEYMALVAALAALTKVTP